MHKGWMFLSATTINNVDGAGWKRLRLFYSAPLRECAKVSRQKRDWGRAWPVNVKSSTPGQLKGISPPHRGPKVLHSVSSVHTNNTTNSSYDGITGWETLPEWRWTWLCCNCREILSKRFRNLYINLGPLSCPSRCAVRLAAFDSPCCRLHPDTRNSLGRHLHGLNSHYEVPLIEVRT